MIQNIGELSSKVMVKSARAMRRSLPFVKIRLRCAGIKKLVICND